MESYHLPHEMVLRFTLSQVQEFSADCPHHLLQFPSGCEQQGGDDEDHQKLCWDKIHQ